MLIELESAYSDKIIHGKYMTHDELQDAMDEILKRGEEGEFLSAFCAHYGYEELQYQDATKVDYVIDLDTHMLMWRLFK